MFCRNCGRQCENEKFCPDCGTPVTKTAPTQQTSQSFTQDPEQPIHQQSYQQNYTIQTHKSGIGGWLLLFVMFIFLFMSLSIISVLGNLAIITVNFSVISFFGKLLYIFIFLLTILDFILSILVFIEIIRRNSAGIYAAILFLFFYIYVQAIVTIAIENTSLIELFFAVIMTIIWVPYFHRSKRVENTLVNLSERRWINYVLRIGGVLMTLGYVGGLVFHIYTVVLLFKIYGFWGFLLSLFLPGISEIYMFIKSIDISGTIHTPYCILALFYLLTTFGIGFLAAYIEDNMQLKIYDT